MATALSASSFSATTFPRRAYPSAVKRSLAPASSRRVAVALAAKPLKMGTARAPTFQQANMTLMTSGTMGM